MKILPLTSIPLHYLKVLKHPEPKGLSLVPEGGRESLSLWLSFTTQGLLTGTECSFDKPNYPANTGQKKPNFATMKPRLWFDK
jgi:hypothetical protein